VGTIYEYMRKQEQGNLFLNTDEMRKFINFYDFINLLELHTDDSRSVIVNYLQKDTDFLKLDSYYEYIEFFDKNGNKITEEYLYEKADTGTLDFLSKKIEYTFNHDTYGEDCSVSYPTKYFLDHLSTRDIDDTFIEIFWNIEDILKLDCMSVIGLDMKAFKECHDVLFSDDKERLNSIRSKNFSEDGQVEEEAQFWSNTRFTSESKSKINSDEDVALHPRSANNASKIISALASELLGMDLTKPFSDETNGDIKAAIERQGNSVSKDVIAYWLKLAHKNSI